MRAFSSIAVALFVCGCCSSETLRRAEARARALESEIVEDRDPDGPPADACVDVDVPLLSLEDVARGGHEGERFAIDGVPVPDAIRNCTEMLCVDDCGHELPCCNSCQSHVRLLVHEPFFMSLRLDGEGLGCMGNRCAIQCMPFGTKPRRSYRFVGRLVAHEWGNGGFNGSFRVERWCRAG